MSLIFPHNPAIAAKHNFAKLLVYGTSEAKGLENLTTAVGVEALRDRKEAELGACHQIRKFTASLAAYTTVVAAPVAAVAGGTLYAFKDYIADPTKVAKDIGSNIYCSFAPSEGCEMGMFSGKNVLLTLAGLGLTDRAINKATSFSPIRSVLSWTGYMLSTPVLYAAHKAGEMTTDSYNAQEKEAAELKKQSNKTLFEQTKAVFDNIADDIVARAEAAKDSPKELLQLKTEIERLEAKMSTIAQGLKEFKLEKTEEIQILDKLVTTIRSIKDMQFILRKAVSDVDHKYNAELMGILTDAEFKGKELSFEVQSLVEEIRANTLGADHAIKAAVLPLLAGFATVIMTQAVGSGLAYAVLNHQDPAQALALKACIMDSATCQGNILTPAICAIALAGTLPALGSSSIAFASLDRSYRKKAKESEAIIERNQKSARKELLDIFNGMAAYLSSKESTDPELQALAQNIFSKIPQVRIAIDNTGLFEDSSIVTQSLEKVLGKILD